MLFNSIEFLVFFLIIYSLYLVLPHKWQNKMLLAGSYYFYGSWDWRYLSLLFASTVCDYICGQGVGSSKEKKVKKRFLAVSITFNLTLLGIFKYYNFFSENFSSLMGQFGLVVQPYFLNVVLPLGISFYTFQTMSYTIDVYRGKVKAEKNFFDYSLYVSFFPQLMAGPIERGARLLPQITNPRSVTLEKLYTGAYLILWGLFLKTVLADNLANMVDDFFLFEENYKGTSVLIGTYAFSVQIYCDFSGYSFMAIGLARVMGIELMENFRRPYFSKNISEFWQRWHISLSNWFKDYLYIPLGGNRNGWSKTFRNAFITMFLCGLWHGSQWTFVVWGAYHAVMLSVYNYIRPQWDKRSRFVQIFLTYHIVVVGWIIFRAYSLDQAWRMFCSIFYDFSLSLSPHETTALTQVVVSLSLLFAVHAFQEWKNDTLAFLKLPLFPRYLFIFSLLHAILFFRNVTKIDFIYFQF